MTVDDADEAAELAAVLRRFARQITDGQAALLAGVATMLATGILLFADRWWILAILAASVAALALWVVLERSDTQSRGVRAGQRFAYATGVALAFIAGLALLMRALGTWIS